jgi:hypothetical protein
MEYQHSGAIEPSPPSSPPPLSTPPPPSSFSQPPPLQFTQAGRPKRNYRLLAQYEDVIPEPLQPLEEEDEQPTAALPRLHLIVRNGLRTVTNSFGLLREYLYRLSFDPDSFVPDENLHRVGETDPVFILPPSPSPVHRNESVEMLMNWKDSGTYHWHYHLQAHLYLIRWVCYPPLLSTLICI